jgi:hypothetical protein
MWRRLAENADTVQRQRHQARPVELRGDPSLRGVREHCAYHTTPALERFIALTERVLIEDEYCIVWKGGDTFRVDDETVVRPARFYWETLLGEKLHQDEALYRTCKTPRCVKHKRKGSAKTPMNIE